MPTTDRRARRLAIARRRPRPVRQGSDEWFRRMAKAFRRVEMYQIARRRARIAAQPRVGDVVIDVDRERWLVRSVGARNICVDDATGLSPLGVWYFTRKGWCEMVRRARRTQEGSAHE